MNKTLSGDKFMSTELDPRIKIRAPLRCDGVGSLDCAEDSESGMRMAVRWLPLDANGAAAARAVQALPSHPTLPKIRGTGRVGSAAFVAMDFPDGKLLSTMLGEPFTPAQVGKLAAETADALATMHAQDVVHGELSADSILLHGTKAVLWDMPLVLANRLTDRRGEERMLSQLPRTIPYLSPERARGVPALASGDIFALGAIIAQLLGAKQPTAQSTLALVHQLGTGAWKPEVPEGAPPELRSLLSRMLQVDPRMRPTARETADHLRTCFEPPAVTAPEFLAVSAKIALELLPPASVVEAPKDAPPPLPAFEAKIESSGPVVVAPAPVVASEPVAVPVEPEPSAIVPVEMRAQIAPTNPEAVPAGSIAEPELRAPKSKAPWILLAALATVAILVLSALLAFSSKVDAPVVKTESKAALALAPTTLIEDDADLLAPLVEVDAFEPHADPAWVESSEGMFAAKSELAEKTEVKSAVAIAVKEAPVPVKKAQVARKPAKKAAVEPREPAEKKQAQAEAVKEIQATDVGNFDFLDKSAPPPSSELKRPSF
jgi:serine/threonine-protein kinase